MITLLVGQPQLLNQKSAFRMGRQTQIVSRFMIDEMQFRGLISADDLATCLAGYDEACFPEKSDWSYTRFRLVNQATLLWSAFLDAHETARFEYALEVPMQCFARSVEIALQENAEHDNYDFTLTPAMWRHAVAECNFVSAQEELRIVMIEDMPLRA